MTLVKGEDPQLNQNGVPVPNTGGMDLMDAEGMCRRTAWGARQVGNSEVAAWVC